MVKEIVKCVSFEDKKIGTNKKNGILSTKLVLKQDKTMLLKGISKGARIKSLQDKLTSAWT